MGKKGGGKKGGKKGKKGPVDWLANQTTKYVEVEVRNSIWQTLRFTQRLPTSTKIIELVKLIIEKHKVAGMSGLTLYLGETTDESYLLRPEEYELALADVKCPGGSINDHVLQVLTYDYAPHRTADTGTHPPTRSYGIMHVPCGLLLPPLRPAY